MTCWPRIEGLGESLEMVVSVVACWTVIGPAQHDVPMKFPSPEYEAITALLPTARSDVLNVALPPDSWACPKSWLSAASTKSTVPVGVPHWGHRAHRDAKRHRLPEYRTVPENVADAELWALLTFSVPGTNVMA